MAKKEVEIVTEFKEPYEGSLSTFAVTIMIVSFGMFLPLITANGVENSRTGRGRFSPQEEIFWDIESNSDFRPIKLEHISDTATLGGRFPWGSPLATYGSVFDQEDIPSGMFWNYKSSNDHFESFQNSYYPLTINVIDLELESSEKVVNEYATASLTDFTTIDEYPNEHYLGTPDSKHRVEHLFVYLDIDVDQWVENDASKFSFYLNAQFTDEELDFIKYIIKVVSIDTGRTYELARGIYDIGDLENITIEIEDLIELLNLKADKNLVLEIAFQIVDGEGDTDETQEFLTYSTVIFDCQVSGIVSRTPSLTIISVWFILESIINIFIGLVMLPMISIGGIAKMFKNPFAK